jgi:hypothetical protein
MTARGAAAFAWLCAAAAAASACATTSRDKTAGAPKAGAADEPASTEEATWRGEGARTSEYYPLAVGHRWTYRAAMLGHTTTREIAIVREQGGFFLDTGGGALMHDAYGLRDQRRYLIRYPIEPGTEWMSVVGPSSVERYRIVDASAVIQVPAGTFERCVVVEAALRVDKDRSLTHRAAYAPGVGLVRLETWAMLAGQAPAQQTRMELVGHQLAPPPAVAPPGALPSSPPATAP